MWGPGLEWNCPLLHSSQSLPGSVESRIIRFFIISLHSEHSNILSKTSFLNQNDYLWLQRQVHCKILFSSPPTYLLVNIHVVKFYAVLIICNHKQKDTLFRLAIVIKKNVIVCLGFPGDSLVKNPPANAEAKSSTPGLGRSPGVGNSSPFQYSCLENAMDRGAWWAAVHGVAQSWAQLKHLACMHALEKEMATHSSILAWRISGTGDPVGCLLWGCTESDTTEAT